MCTLNMLKRKFYKNFLDLICFHKHICVCVCVCVCIQTEPLISPRLSHYSPQCPDSTSQKLSNNEAASAC